MAVKAVTIDYSELESFLDKMGQAGSGQLKKELEKFVESIGNEFLRVLEDEIIRLKVMDTRLLLNSFHKESDDNVWKISDGGLTLEVGTNVTYASYVNDGHWTNPKGQAARWVPGEWQGERFRYDPNADTGMLLKQKWVEGSHYFDSALRIMEQMIPQFMERKMEQWLMNYFR